MNETRDVQKQDVDRIVNVLEQILRELKSLTASRVGTDTSPTSTVGSGAAPILSVYHPTFRSVEE